MDRAMSDQESAKQVAAMTPLESLTRGTIQQLIGRCNAVPQLLTRARFNSRPVDLTPFLLESLAITMQGVALLLDEQLVEAGLHPEVEPLSRPAPENGNGKDGPALVRP